MQVVTATHDLRQHLDMARREGKTIGLVATMGAIHAGHIALLDLARRETDVVVMSIFVNPTQFGANEDFDQYPRSLQGDLHEAESRGVDLAFVPDVTSMYPDGPEKQQVWIEPGPLAAYLCGPFRPGHFRGVATVVAKLFNLVLPDRAYFGQKDAQQATIIQRMVRDLAFSVEIVVVPTSRAADGLALSSRNAHLSASQRTVAPSLYRALKSAKAALEGGASDAQAIEGEMRRHILDSMPDARIDYATVAQLDSLEPIYGPARGRVLIALAVYVGTTRLIDNVIADVGTPALSRE